MRSITTYEGYEDFKKECSFFYCQEIYEGDWLGVERYIICTDTPELALVERFPMIMKALSPYLLCGSNCAEVFGETKKNLDKFKKRSLITDSVDESEFQHEYEYLSSLPLCSTVEGKVMFMDALLACTPLQRERIQQYYFENMTLAEIAGGKYSTQAVGASIQDGIKNMKKYFEAG